MNEAAVPEKYGDVISFRPDLEEEQIAGPGLGQSDAARGVVLFLRRPWDRDSGGTIGVMDEPAAVEAGRRESGGS